jgi:lambda family phage minor tail protein L
MSVLNDDLERPFIDARIELFSIDVSRDYPSVNPNKFYFCAGVDENAKPLYFRGIKYTPLPLQTNGFELTSDGNLPTPKVTIANPKGIISDICLAFADLVNAKVSRILTLAKYLDGGTSPNPQAVLSEDIFFIAQKSEENKFSVSFILNVFDLETVTIPSRKIQANFCTATYRNADSGCPYAGPAVANYLDAPTSNSLLDSCGHRLSSCKLRFGQGVLPFNGFPGSG